MQHYQIGGRSRAEACLGGDGLPTEAAHSNSQPPFGEGTARALPQHHLRPVVLHCHTHMPAHIHLFRFHTCITHMSTAGEPSVDVCANAVLAAQHELFCMYVYLAASLHDSYQLHGLPNSKWLDFCK